MAATHQLSQSAAAELLSPPVRRKLGAVRRSDWLALVGAAAGALSLASMLFFVIVPLSGWFMFVALAYVFFLALTALLVSFDETGPVVWDRLAAVVMWSLGFVLFGVLIFVVGYVGWRGIDAMSHWNFYSQDMTKAGPQDPLDTGGMLHALVGTLEQIAIALAITVPLGLTCAVFLNEFPGRFARFVRTIVEAMTALPSIIAGLFIYATFLLMLGYDKSGLAAALALGVMMLPIIIRAADVVIRLVPAPLREASYALGTSRWRTVWHVVLPTARSGLTTAVILGTARGIGETSPVLLTAGFTAALNANPTKDPQVSLPLATFNAVMSPEPTMVARGFGAATLLLALVLFLFVLARIVGGRAPGHDTAGQRRRRRKGSARDAARFAARASAVAIAFGLVGISLAAPRTPAYAEDYVPISGAGSTWSANAIEQWRRNVDQYGIRLNYAANGSSDGRNQFRNGTVDFAVSEIPYGLKDAGVYDSPPSRDYAYMPIVAGGTAFMYNLKIGGKRVTNLRLSGENIVRIFTGKITMWDDPAIARDNPLLALPARKIVPVVRSDGSGTTAQLTTWMSKEYGSLWDSYCRAAGRPTPCGVTSVYPVKGGSGFVAQAYSTGVASFVSQEQNQGTITYVEYSYALNSDYPVAKVLNKSGYYVEPTAENVAVGLLGARIQDDDPDADDYLTQILDGVYRNGDRRAYPLSSYSYMILPTEVSGSFNEAKGRTLADFAYYFLCEGQQSAPVLGYSPLPINLVQKGMKQVRRIPGVDVQNIDISKCNNPTFSNTGRNTLAQNAPYPPACDKAGDVQCTTGTGGADDDTDVTSPPGSDTDGDGEDDPSGDGGGGDDGGGGGKGAGKGDPGETIIDPETGAVIPADGSTTTDGIVVTGQAISLDTGETSQMRTLLMVLAAVVLALVVLVPPLVGQYLSKGRVR